MHPGDVQALVSEQDEHGGGAYTSSLWRMTFGYTAPVQWDTRIKGRGVVGIGEAEELIHHAQIAWMPAEERRRYALTGPEPPAWFTAMRPAPDHRPCRCRVLPGL